MREPPAYPARTITFPDGVEGQVRLIGADRQPEDPMPAAGSIDVAEGKAAAFFGQLPGPDALAGAEGLTHFFLASPVDKAVAERLASLPFLRQVSGQTDGLTGDGFDRLVAAPHLASVALSAAGENDGGAAIAERAVEAGGDVAIELVVGPAALATVCELAEQGRVQESLTIDVQGAEERDLLPLRKLWPDRDLNGVRYSPKALARIEASLGP